MITLAFVSGHERELSALISVSFPALSWFLSLRRNSAQTFWLIYCALIAFLCFIIGIALTRVSFAGDIAVAGLLVGSLAWIPALFVEAITAWENGSTGRNLRNWREQHGLRPHVPSIPKGQDKWHVEIGDPVRDGKVPVFIVKGNSRREIGSEDPIIDGDGFANLLVRADQAIETYNAYKVGKKWK